MAVTGESIKNLCNYILECSTNEPLTKRIKLYSDVAQILPDEDLSRELHVVIKELKSAEKQANQIYLKLKLQ